MSPEAQRIAIAEACGWKYVEGLDVPSLSFNGASKCGDCWVCPKRGAGYGEYEPPNYLSDLNAMHQAEKILTSAHQPSKGESQWSDYLGWLGFCGENKTREVYECVTASAAQRAEAFLRVIGKWQDE